jgi:type 1 glutamine amidotransferase
MIDSSAGGAGKAAGSGSGGISTEPQPGGGASGQSAAGSGGESGATARAPELLIFSRTAGYRHTSIELGVAALARLAQDRGWRAVASDDPAQFTDATLADFNVVVFLSTTGDVLDEAQQAAFERFIRAGNGFVGIHAAADTEYDWPWYGELVGAYFKAHPEIQPASIIVEDQTHPSTAHLPSTWQRTDEWYGFRANPRDAVHVLLRLDETSYSAGDGAMGADHPIAWYHDHDGGRAFYTALGHTDQSYSDELFLSHLAGALTWAAAR